MPRKDLSTPQRNQVVQFLLENSKSGKPLWDKHSEAVIKFGLSRRTISCLWAAARQQQQNGQVFNLQSAKVSSSRKNRVQNDIELIGNLELYKRSTIRRLAAGINCSKSTVGRWINKRLIKAHTSVIKPDLIAPNKLLSLRFSLEILELDRILNTLKFRSMHDVVHIDKKWLYITRGTHRFYMTLGEAEPHRTCKSKKFITKMMFMCVVCRSTLAADGTLLFDGKIGILHFTEKVAAQRTSKNRVAGTLETKPIESITKQILSAIKVKWPTFASKKIYIQQDNARPHIKDSDPDFRAAVCTDGLNISLVQQPPNSLDVRVNVLDWFRAIQSIQIETACYTVDQLIDAVVLSFQDLSPTTLNNVFLSLQGCVVEIMKVRGQNCYKIPHMKK